MPNPASHYLEIVSDNQAILSIEIYNNIGKLISEDVLKGQQNRIDITTFPNGVYMIRLEDKQRKYAAYKLIKQ